MTCGCGRPATKDGACPWHWRAPPPTTAEERFLAAINRDGPLPEHRPELGPCWLWTASLSHGYGQMWLDGKLRRAHVLAYDLMVGPVPDGLHLDHLCERRACVRPSHLEPVTPRENTRRMVAAHRRDGTGRFGPIRIPNRGRG